jgi:hypothetical protein
MCLGLSFGLLQALLGSLLDSRVSALAEAQSRETRDASLRDVLGASFGLLQALLAG